MTVSRLAVSILALCVLATPSLAAPHPSLAKPEPSAADNAANLVHQADAAKAKGDMDLALRLAQAAIVADPAKPETYDVLGDLYADQGEKDFARFYYNEALDIDPGDSGAGKGIAALGRAGNEQAAEASTPGK